jgi:hypothetical protein
MINFHRYVIALCSFGFLFSSAYSVTAIASTTSYDLTGDTNNLSVSYGNNFYSYYVDTLQLTNAATGSSTLSGFTLNVGDIINGTITLNNPLTMPAGTFEGIEIELLAIPNDYINMDGSVSFYDNGVQVYPAGFSVDYSSGAALGIGMSTGSLTTPGFSFDKISFSATVTGIQDYNNQNLTSVNLQNYSPTLTTTAPTAVPVPAAVWLFGSSFAGLGFFGRRRKAA